MTALKIIALCGAWIGIACIGAMVLAKIFDSLEDTDLE